MSFSIGSTSMVCKNRSSFAAVGSNCNCSSAPVAASGVVMAAGPTKTQVCYSPKNATGTVSLVHKSTEDKRKITTDLDTITIPSNAIIDMIEFFGINGFSTKGLFSVGLGQLNDTIRFPMIVDSNMSIANERVGGCRQFTSIEADGKNAKNIVLYPSYINAMFEHPVTAGSLQVVIYYHLKTT